jgi:perosamine synthetase
MKKNQKFIPIFEPYLIGNEKKYLQDCIDTNWISSQGKYIQEFEKYIAKYHGVNFGIATSNCTTALHLALKSLGVSSGDEVICPDLTFIAPANMIVLSGAKLILVDIDSETLALDPKLIEKKITKRTKAIIVVHQFGHSAPMDEILCIAKKYNLKIIEDNAESIGGKYKGKLLGTLGDISCFSFFGNKILTTGEGGAILTNDPNLAIKCKELRDHGMSSAKKYFHTALGFNYRMTNMQAAIGLAQLERLDSILISRNNQLCQYYNLLKDIPAIKLRSFQSWCEPVHWLLTMTISDEYERDTFIQYMKKNDIECRPMINPVHQAEHFKNQFKEKEFENSIKVSTRSVHLPSSTSLSPDDIIYICKLVKCFFQKK